MCDNAHTSNTFPGLSPTFHIKLFLLFKTLQRIQRRVNILPKYLCDKGQIFISYYQWLELHIRDIFVFFNNFQTIMRGLLRGILYCALWYGSIVAGFLFIACPFLPLFLFSPPKFRKCGDLLFSCWELYPTVSTPLISNFTNFICPHKRGACLLLLIVLLI